MSRYDLFIDIIDDRLHAAVIRKTELNGLYIDDTASAAAWASIYLGKVTKVDTRLNAAIVDLGNGLQGYLAAKHTLSAKNRPATHTTKIGDNLSPGQMVLVQVKTEGRAGSALENRKMPRLTMKLHMMGHALHHTPLLPDVQNAAFSPDAAAWLKDKDGGWIIRHPAAKTELAKIQAESAYLAAVWKAVRTAAASMAQPGLLRRGPNAIQKTLCDYGLPAFEHIHVGNKTALSMVMDWAADFDPALAASKRLRLFRPEKPMQKLFDIHDIYHAIDELFEPVVPLPSGGSIVIEQTSALVVVDVNQGASDNIAACNNEAAAEIARQLRLRNISGAILVDVINMPLKSERLQLLDRLDAVMKEDPVMSQCHGFTRLGIVEITRKRRDGQISEKLTPQARKTL